MRVAVFVVQLAQRQSGYVPLVVFQNSVDGFDIAACRFLNDRTLIRKDGERMANRVRNIVLRVPVTAQEREMIELKMQQMGTRCFSTYARKMLIDGYVIKIDYSDIKAMTAELQKIGTNINQIAKRVNATGEIYAQDIEDIKGVLAEIWLSQRSILSKAP